MNLCMIPGDGIGPEVMDAAQRVIMALCPDTTITEAQAGWGTFQQTGAALPEATREAALAADAVFFGAVASPSHPVPGYRSPIVALRKALDLYANIRPTSNAGLPGSPNQQTGDLVDLVDLVIVRENTEGLYAGRERLEDDGATAIAERVITRSSSERIVRTAFDLVRTRNKPHPKVTIVHKANVLRVSDGLFREAALGVAQGYPDVETEELLVDTAAMHLARSPERFDVIVTTNMFGDILSDVACIHGGGLGLASSANLGDQHALFEPVHGAAPDIAGRGVANPLAALGCVAMWLEWQERTRKQQDAAVSLALRLRTAIDSVLRNGPHTPDLGGNTSTQDVTTSVIQQLDSNT